MNGFKPAAGYGLAITLLKYSNVGYSLVACHLHENRWFVPALGYARGDGSQVASKTKKKEKKVRDTAINK